MALFVLFTGCFFHPAFRPGFIARACLRPLLHKILPESDWKEETFLHSKAMFFEKFKEAAASVLPITLIVALMCFSFIPVTPDLLLAFLLGAVLLIVGMGM